MVLSPLTWFAMQWSVKAKRCVKLNRTCSVSSHHRLRSSHGQGRAWDTLPLPHHLSPPRKIFRADPLMCVYVSHHQRCAFLLSERRLDMLMWVRPLFPVHFSTQPSLRNSRIAYPAGLIDFPSTFPDLSPVHPVTQARAMEGGLCLLIPDFSHSCKSRSLSVLSLGCAPCVPTPSDPHPFSLYYKQSLAHPFSTQQTPRVSFLTRRSDLHTSFIFILKSKLSPLRCIHLHWEFFLASRRDSKLSGRLHFSGRACHTSTSVFTCDAFL